MARARYLFRMVGALLIAGAILAASCAGGNGAVDEQMSAPEISSTAPVATLPQLGAREALGQLLIGRYYGTVPPRELLDRVGAGRVGGVILFADNTEDGGGAVRRAINRLQRAAVGAGNPPLLISIDQEGGIVKRLPGPPALSPQDMRPASTAFRQGRLTGRNLRRLGINLNLAPVADVPSPGSFMTPRTFGDTPAAVATRACAFARGLIAEGVAATLKHFPGLGKAPVNTDDSPSAVSAPARALRRDYAAYRRCGDHPMTLTMVSSAGYPSLFGNRQPAVVTPDAYRRELRGTGFRGVTISDDMETPALEPVASPATRGIRAGLHLALYAGTEQGSATAYRVLLNRIARGTLPRRLIIRRATAVLRLKARLEPALTAGSLTRRGGDAER